VRSEVFTAVRMMMMTTIMMMFMFLWVLAPCRLIGRGQRFGEKHCLHFQNRSSDTGMWWDYIYIYIRLKEGKTERVGKPSPSYPLLKSWTGCRAGPDTQVAKREILTSRSFEPLSPSP
jgi:hypothetical protein